MCMLCDEEAFYRAYLEHKAKVEAEGQARAEAETGADAQGRAGEATEAATPAAKITE